VQLPSARLTLNNKREVLMFLVSELMWHVLFFFGVAKNKIIDASAYFSPRGRLRRISAFIGLLGSVCYLNFELNRLLHF
jgi:hypothetical protein